MTNPTILVADNDPVWMNSMAHLLEMEGYHSLRARTGVDALYQTLMRRPDLVLLNPDLPQLSGWQVCRRLKRSPGLGSVKVVLLTLEGEAAYRAGADGYLVKGGQVEPVLPAIRAFHHPASGILGAFLHRRVIAA
jgi:two-component system, OmpR family, phosphate regulon response regulator PhoB